MSDLGQTPTPGPGSDHEAAAAQSLWRGRVPLGAGGDIRTHAARGSLINGGFLIGLTALGFVKLVIVAGLLDPREYGVWGVLSVSLGTLVWLKHVGIGDKYIQQDEPDQELAFQKAFTLELIVTAAFVVFLLAMVPVVTLIYGEPDLLLPGWVAVLALPAGLLSAPLWVFYRRMQFFQQRTLQAIDPLVSFVVTLALAAAGAGYWSLIVGTIAGAWAAGLVALRYSPYKIRLRYDRGTMREYMGFSWPLFFDQVASVAIAQSAILVGEWQLGLAGVGAIALASTIVAHSGQIDGIVTGTLYPAVCAVKDRTDLLFETFVKSNRLTLLWGIPFGVGVALFAPDFVEFVIGGDWSAAVGLIQAYGLLAALNHVAFNWGAYFRARGNTRPMAVVSAAMMIACFATVIPLTITDGLTGFAIGMTVMTVVGLAGRAYYLTRLFDGFAMLRHGARALAPTLPAAAAVLAVRLVESGERTPAIAVGEVALFLSAVIVATIFLERPLLREAIGYVRGRGTVGAGVPA